MMVGKPWSLNNTTRSAGVLKSIDVKGRVFIMETNLQEKQSTPIPLGISGLGGWLVLVQIGIYGTLLLTCMQLFLYSIPSFQAETWSLLTSKESEIYHPLWGPVITFEAVYNALLIVFCIYILFHFYAKKWILPRLMIIFYAGSLLFGVIDYSVLQLIPMAREADGGGSIRDLIRSFFTCVIWIPYFLRSVRVKNTFIR
jgi:hypothetical protein